MSAPTQKRSDAHVPRGGSESLFEGLRGQGVQCPLCGNRVVTTEALCVCGFRFPRGYGEQPPGDPPGVKSGSLAKRLRKDASFWSAHGYTASAALEREAADEVRSLEKKLESAQRNHDRYAAEATRALDAMADRAKDAEAKVELARQRALLVLRVTREDHRPAEERLRQIEGEAEHFYFTATGTKT